MNFDYTLGVLYTTPIERMEGDDLSSATPFCEIDEQSLPKGWRDLLIKGELVSYDRGFHSIGKKILDEYKNSRILFRDIYECVIPKGSEYVEDFVGFIVSNQIIIKSKYDKRRTKK
jgi:hypothetical protein